jgi:signal transduction histidine kinase/CheY-like chemotaxis protein
MRHLLVAYLAFAVGGITLHFSLPVGSIEQGVVYQTVNGLATIMVLLGIKVFKPDRALHWWLLAIGLLFNSGGDITYNVYDWIAAERPFPSVADGLYLTSYGLFALAFLSLIGYRHRPRLTDALDGAIVAAGGAVFISFWLIAPIASDHSSTAMSRLVSAAYPTMDILFVVALAQFFFMSRARATTSFRLLVAGAVVLPGVDVLYGLQELDGSYVAGSWLDGGWMLMTVLWGTAALHHSMRTLHEHAPRPVIILTWRRLILLGGASLVGPIVLAMHSADGSRVELSLMLVAAALSTVLIFTRMGLLFRDNARAVSTLRAAEAREALSEERRELEERLVESQRIESVGLLAGGIAHDFNNLLMGISGYAELAAAKASGQPELQRDIGEIAHSADRAADLTKQLLAFSRRQLLSPRVLDLNTSVREVEGMVRRLIGERVNVVTALDVRVGPVTADPAQLDQIIVNLAVNARDAMPNGGILRIATSEVVLDEEDAARLGAWPGPHAVLSVEDEGEGMTADVVAHCFEPFFTTKELGKGTGLGLSTVYGIVQQSGGVIRIVSAPHEGTRFEVYLPRSFAPVDAVDAVAPGAPAPSGTVLLVEDDTMVRRVIVSMLEQAGYDVVAAEGPAEALVLAESNPRLDVAVTDVVMPGMSGPGFAQRLHEFRPELPVLFISGYPLTEADELAPQDTLLQKPFSTVELGQALQGVLERAALVSA